MDNEYDIVKYTTTHRSQLLELQRHLWSDDLAWNDAYLAWKYDQNPYVNDLHIYLALHQGKVVGMRGMYGADWVVGRPGRSIRALGAGDLVIAPEHRDRGLFTRIMTAAVADLAARGYDYLFNLTSGRATRLGSLTMEWRSPGELATMRRVVDSADCPEEFRRNRFLWLDQGRELLPERIVLENGPRPALMAEVVRRADAEGRIRHRRDETFFTWRFQNPFSEYRFLFWVDGAPEGYLVLQTSRRPNRQNVAIVDWEGTTVEVRFALLETALRLGRFTDLHIWSSSLSDTVRGQLANAGFRQRAETNALGDHVATVLIRPLRDTGQDWEVGGRRLLNLDDWELRLSYSDMR